jgi:hypothetical protein
MNIIPAINRFFEEALACLQLIDKIVARQHHV